MGPPRDAILYARRLEMAHDISRRDLLGVLPASFVAPLLAQQRAAPRPFMASVPQPTIDRILNRVKETRLPDRLDAPDWRYGANWAFMQTLTEYWTSTFDWRKAEANLNRYPQFLARVDDFDIHFYHVKGRGPKPLPLVLTHGWPGSVFEFIEAIGPLSDPARFGGSADDAFDVVVPFPIGPPTVARLWHKLMTEALAYSRFGAQGGDWGSAITRALAREFPDSLAGIHLNMGGGVPPPENEMTDEERAWQRAATTYRAEELDYLDEQQHKPGTVSFVLYDNPVGTAAWIIEKFKVWSDSGDDIERTFTKDQLLTNVMIYLVSDTVATAVWIYRGNADDRSGPPSSGRLSVPVGIASFPREMRVFDQSGALHENAEGRSFRLPRAAAALRGRRPCVLPQSAVVTADVRNGDRPRRGPACVPQLVHRRRSPHLTGWRCKG
ncbi:MAG: hypothetical protein DMG03_26860 [Acidobacteria bacterium]|nr:MAG: hypothetical protein DMG03_26860 [Acidobacteriota bacterium]